MFFFKLKYLFAINLLNYCPKAEIEIRVKNSNKFVNGSNL